MTASTDSAYERCERITREQARNFYYGIRLLPAPRRAALCAVYALARRIDDIGDDVTGQGGAATVQQRQAGLDQLRAALRRGDGSDPVIAAVLDAAARYPIPLDAFEEIVEGVEMDLQGRRYATFDELVDYCRCVAGSVGRLCLGVFVSRPDPRAPAYANALGIALQQTNTLRDVREDLLSGRVYLPQEDLDRFGVELTVDVDGRLADPDGSLAALLTAAADRAAAWYREGLQLLPLLDRRSAACCGAMAGIYARLLDRIARDPTRVYGGRLSLSGREKAAVAGRALAGRAP